MKCQVQVDGHPMGTYSGESKQEILDAYARDAGYNDYDDLLAQVPGSKTANTTLEPAPDDRQLIVEWKTVPRVNSGALVQPRIRYTDRQIRLFCRVVAVSASSHIAPTYPRSAEAPRIYQEHPVSYKTAWLQWLERTLTRGGQKAYYRELSYEALSDPDRIRDRLLELVRENEYLEITESNRD